jgi:hypothetical protein
MKRTHTFTNATLVIKELATAMLLISLLLLFHKLLTSLYPSP